MQNGRNEILKANGLYHVYESKAEDGNVVALRGLHVTVYEGEAVAVVGPSGSGKSTLLKCLGGLMKPSAGGVELEGSRMTRLTGTQLVELRQKTVSFIFQDSNLLPHLNALDNVAQPLRHQGVLPGIARAKAQALLDRLGMGDRSRGMPEELSGGEQQRVAIARAFACSAKILFADEPTGNLDPKNGKLISDLLFEVNSETDNALVIVTHDQDLASQCDKKIELKLGKIID